MNKVKSVRVEPGYSDGIFAYVVVVHEFDTTLGKKEMLLDGRTVEIQLHDFGERGERFPVSSKEELEKLLRFYKGDPL